jgi:hypothetical protein
LSASSASSNVNGFYVRLYPETESVARYLLSSTRAVTFAAWIVCHAPTGDDM